MKKFLKTILTSLIFSAVFFILVIFMGKIFPAEIYIVKSAVSLKDSTFPETGYDSSNLKKDENISSDIFYNDFLMLVNEEHPLPENYKPDLVYYKEIYMNRFVAKAYKKLAEEIKNKFENSLFIMSAYRPPSEQASINESGNEYAASVDSSEHLTGLALDVYVKYYAGMGFLDCAEGQFVNSFCQNYGFIIRYPYYGKNITGISFEPWHLRYVGLPHSEIIMNNKLTLEEYIESYIPGEIYYYENYMITRQKDPKLIPEGISEITISPDNTGYYIITGKY